MGAATWLRNHWFGVSTVVFLVAAGLLAVAAVYGGLVLLAAAVTADATLLSVVIDGAVPFLAVGAALLVTALVSGAGVAWGLGRRLWDVSARGLDRVADWAAGVEADDYRAAVPAAGERGGDHRRAAVAALKRTYVAGDIGEREFERAVEGLAAADAERPPTPEPLAERE